MRDKDSPSRLLIKRLAKHLRARNVIVTQGNEGALFYNTKLKKFIKAPAFGSVIKDKVGSGDLFLSIFSIINSVTENAELALYTGSLCAAETLKEFGNSKILTKEQLEHKFLVAHWKENAEESASEPIDSWTEEDYQTLYEEGNSVISVDHFYQSCDNLFIYHLFCLI